MGKVDSAASDVTLSSPYETGPSPNTSGPTSVGRYQIGGLLGAGAMGVVYHGYDPHLGRPVAIKLVRDSHASATSHSRLLREAQAMARLRHRNVLSIFDVGQADGGVFVAMPLLEGGTLKRWLRDAPRSFGAILDRFVAAGRGLAAAHAAGIVHRDFKPENVLLDADGEVHVGDFGLARLADEDPPRDIHGGLLTAGALTQAGVVLGTLPYMAPEQLRRQPLDARADQFSFCVALWEAIYGVRPFPDLDPDAKRPLRMRFDAIAAGPMPPPRGRCPAWISPLLVRGLAVDPDRRWPTVQALLDEIARYRSRRRWPRWVAVGACASGLIITLTLAPSTPPRPIPQFHLVPLTHRGDLKAAAISPDGENVAMVVGDSLVIRGIEPGAGERIVIDHGIADGLDYTPLGWSPDNKHILFASAPVVAGLINMEVVDIDSHARSATPTAGGAAFLSSTEVGTWAYREHSISRVRIDGLAATETCEVPGDYTFLWDLIGMPDGTMVIDTMKGEFHTLVILDRNCRVRATFSGELFSSAAASDTGTIVVLVSGSDVDEIVEVSLDGTVVSRRRIRGSPDKIIGRRHGADYVSTLSIETHLDRLRNGAPIIRQFSATGNASFSLAPDGETLAWVESDARGFPGGRLRLSTLSNLSSDSPALLDRALMAGWSPNGQSLAVVVDDTTTAPPSADSVRPAGVAPTSLVIVDRKGNVLRRTRLDHIYRESAPVWLDDHRIAVHAGDRTTYRWFDLNTAEQGKIVDSGYGSTYWLTRSPRDGTLAMWRNGPPGAVDARPDHVWLQTIGQPARPLHIDGQMKHFLMPSWSPSGELLVRAMETGRVSRVALDTGELTTIAQLQPTPMSRLFDNHLMTLPDGDLLAVNIDLGINVEVAISGEDSGTASATQSASPQ